MFKIPKRNEHSLIPALRALRDSIENEDFIVDSQGGRTAELIGTRIVFNVTQATMDFDVKKTNTDYVKRELGWYLSGSLNIHPIMDGVKIWEHISDPRGYVNSNYGHLIFSEDNGCQYKNCVERLLANRHTKRAVMIYTRPTMWKDCHRGGMDDFICTDGVQCTVRGNSLIYMVKQRSCDLIYGLFNDLAWHQFVASMIVDTLKLPLEKAVIVYFPFNLHVYEKHFRLIAPMLKYAEDNYGKNADRV